MTRHDEMYLEWFNWCVTGERVAEYHDITPDEANQIINQGRRDHYSRHEGHRLLRQATGLIKENEE